MPDQSEVQRSRKMGIPPPKHAVSPAADRPLIHDSAARAKLGRRPCSDTKLVSDAWHRARACEDPAMRSLRQALAIAALLVAAALGMAGPGMAADDKTAERFVSVSASGSVSAVPDLATISAGVLTEGDTARDALSRNNVAMARLI